VNIRAVSLGLCEGKHVDSLVMPYGLDPRKWVVGCDDLDCVTDCSSV
jgi:hypothetical protein